MRTWGRVNGNWAEVQTDANGFSDYVYATALIQELKLNLGESPFWGNRGIPAHPSVVQQIAPDYYTMLMQQRYAPFFLSLIITKIPNAVQSGGAASTGSGWGPGFGSGFGGGGSTSSLSQQPLKTRPIPTYRINITTMVGVQLELEIPT